MRTLKYALLGLLNEESMTGYDLAKQFDHALLEFWHAKHSQIYPELKKLHDEGFVSYTVEISGNVLEKKVYCITDSGRDELVRWLSLDEDMGFTHKDVFRLRVFFSSNLDIDSRIEMFERQLLRHEKRLKHLQGNNEKFGGVVPDRDTHLFGDFLVLKSAMMREEMLIDWLKYCIAMCSESDAGTL